MIEKIHKAVMANGKAILAVVLVVSVVMSVFAVRVRYDNSLTMWYLEDDPNLLTYQQFLDKFGSDEAILLQLFVDDVFGGKTLTEIHELSEAMEGIPDVEYVTSLTDEEAVIATEDALEIRPIFKSFPPSKEEILWARDYVKESSTLKHLVSPDNSSTVLILHIAHKEESFEYRVKIIRSVKELLKDKMPGIQYNLAGEPVIDEAFFRYSERDALISTPIILVVILILFWWLFRNAVPLLLSIGVVGLSVLWSFGLMGLLGYESNLITVILPGILIAIGIADAVHILVEFRLELRTRKDIREAIDISMMALWRPCLLTSVTTIAGLLSLLTASLAPVRELGIAAAFGVGVAFILTVTFLPVCLSLLPERWVMGMAEKQNKPMDRIVKSISEFGWKRSYLVLGVFSLVFIIAIAGMTRIRVGSNFMTYFYEDDPIVQQSFQLEKIFGGSLPVEMLIEARQGTADWKSPALLAGVDRIESFLRENHYVTEPLSPVDLLKEIKKAIMGTDKADLPASRSESAQLYLLLEGSDFYRRYLTENMRYGRVSFMVPSKGYDVVVAAIPEFQETFDNALKGQGKATLTGLLPLMAQMEVYIVETQIRSFSLSFLMVFGFITLLFRSLRMGLLSLIPNLPPIAMTLGIMGWVGMALDSGTVMIAGILLGIIVDDSVHFLSRRENALQGGRSPREAVHETILTSGRAIILTSLILCVAFLTLISGSFKPNVNFGILSAVAIGLALACDLLVLPATLRIIASIKNLPLRH